MQTFTQTQELVAVLMTKNKTVALLNQETEALEEEEINLNRWNSLAGVTWL